MSAPTVALTHHWLVRRRGGEKVLDAFRELFPEAPIATLIHDERYDWPSGRPASISASFLNSIPGVFRHYPKMLPLMPWAARRMELPPVDVVLCSDAAIAKAMRVRSRTKLICYCHSPMRYAWDLREEYRRTLPLVLRPLWGPVTEQVRRADKAAALRVDVFVANSKHVAERIRRSYDRESVVIHPPVDLPERTSAGKREDFYLCVGHHVTYKRLDLAVEACNRMGRRLVVIGEGPDTKRLRAVGGAVQWLGWQTDAVVDDHLRRARGLLFPGEEDFGIVPVEAMARGCPVIAYGVGGATETVRAGVTGILFPEQTAEAVIRAIDERERRSFDPAVMFEHCRQFGKDRFLREIAGLIETAVAAEKSR